MVLQSRSGYYIAVLIDRAHYIMPEEVHDVIGPYIHQLDETLGEGDRHHHHDHFHATGSGEEQPPADREAVAPHRPLSQAVDRYTGDAAGLAGGVADALDQGSRLLGTAESETTNLLDQTQQIISQSRRLAEQLQGQEPAEGSAGPSRR
jgi:hypothetical protein